MLKQVGSPWGLGLGCGDGFSRISWPAHLVWGGDSTLLCSEES